MHRQAIPLGSQDFAAAQPDRTEEDLVFSKVSWHIMPIILLAYILAFLDRINVGYTQLQMKQALGFSDAVYGLGAGIFFISYLLLEVPSNLLLEKVGARLTFLRIMVPWGLCSAATMFVTEPWHFYTLRFLLGVFEAGFFPGVILYLTYWYPSHRRGRVTGLFLFGMPITGVIAGPLTGLILTSMDGVNGWAGWQWVFLLEGLPTVLVGLLVYGLLADSPKDARWLTPREKQVVLQTLEADRDRLPQDHGHGHGRLRAALSNPRTYLLGFVYFCCACAVYTFTFWLPTLVRELGVTSLAQIGWYTLPPFAFGALAILLMGWSSDRFRERRWHVAVGLILGSIALFVTTTYLSGSLWTSIPGLCVAGFFIFGGGVVFWAIPPSYLSREAAAAGIAVISSMGILGGFVSPTLIGLIKGWTGSITGGLAVITALICAGGIAVLLGVPAEPAEDGRTTKGIAP